MADTWGALQLPAQTPNVAGGAWTPATRYAAGAFVVPNPQTGFAFRVAAVAGTGTSGTLQPTPWPTTIGATIIDNAGANQITWVCAAKVITPEPGKNVPGDPLLEALLSYLKASVPPLLAAAWGTKDVAPTRSLVLKTFPYDPGKYGFVDTDVPALYAWRDSDPDTEWLAADYTLDKSTIQLVYVFEPHGNPEVEKTRAPFANALRKAIVQVIENERDPAWVVPGDPDPTAAAEGSVLATFAGFFELNVGKGKPGLIRTPKATVFSTYEVELRVKEMQTRDVSLFPLMTAWNNTYELVSAPNPWQASSLYDATEIVTPTTSTGFTYQAMTSGVTAGVEPVWPTTIGLTVNDGSLEWQCLGAVDAPLVIGVENDA